MSDKFESLCEFLRNVPLTQITNSSILYQLWSLNDIQTEKNDYKCIIRLLHKVEDEDVSNDRKEHLRLLQDNNQIRYCRNELISLMDAGLLKKQFKKDNWRETANNIAIVKTMLQSENTPIHKHILKELNKINITDLTFNDPLCNGIIDISSNRFQINESDYKILTGKNVNKEIKHYNKFVLMSTTEKVTYDQWTENEYDRERIARDITNILLQELKYNSFQRISHGSEHDL
ncbi:4021_t:CDS:2, partial [Ambispora gerdemannii]